MWFHLFRRHQQPVDETQPDVIQSQAIDISDAVWDTYRVAHLDYFKHQEFAKLSWRKIYKRYPLTESHHLELRPVYKWINDLIDCWTMLAVPDDNAYRSHYILESNHSDNFYEISMHERLYHDLKGFLLQQQSKPFQYPECYQDPSHGRLILPGDEQHFLLPEQTVFDSYKYNNRTEWNRFRSYLRKKKGLQPG